MAEVKKTEAAKPAVATIKTPVAAEKAEVKAEAKTETKAAPKKAAAKKAAAPKKEAAAKKEAAPKAAKKEAAPKKEAVKKAAAPKKEAAPKKTAAKKEAAPKKAAAEVKTNIVLQYGDKSVTYDTIIQNAKGNYQYDMGGIEEIKKLSVYVKPEEDAAYYVVNDKVQGRIGL
jgi:hypothetical protein